MLGFLAFALFYECCGEKKKVYQLINELFPAEWFPINITVIFFLGGSRVTPTDWATVISPGVQKRGGGGYDSFIGFPSTCSTFGLSHVLFIETKWLLVTTRN